MKSCIIIASFYKIGCWQVAEGNIKWEFTPCGKWWPLHMLCAIAISNLSQTIFIYKYTQIGEIAFCFVQCVPNYSHIYLLQMNVMSSTKSDLYTYPQIKEIFEHNQSHEHEKKEDLNAKWTWSDEAMKWYRCISNAEIVIPCIRFVLVNVTVCLDDWQMTNWWETI